MSLWRVLPHALIEKRSDNLWRVEGSMPNGPLKRVMTMVRRPNGNVFIHNAIAMDDSSMQALEAWGPVREIMIPNGFHRLDAPMFHERYPEAQFFAPKGSLARAKQAIPACIGLSQLVGDTSLQALEFEGTKSAEGALVISSSNGKTLVLNDILFNMPHVAGFPGFVLKHITKSSGGPTLSRLARLFLVKNKAILKQELLGLAKTPDLRAIIVSHHETITEGCDEVLRRLADSL